MVWKPLKNVGKFHVSRHSIVFVLLFLIEAAQKNEEKGDAKYETSEFSNAADFYTEGIEVSCKDVALNAVLYKKRAACHFFLGEFRTILDSQFSYNKRRRDRLVVTALLIWRAVRVWALARDTALCSWARHYSHGASLHKCTNGLQASLMLGLTLRWTGISHFMLQKPGYAPSWFGSYADRIWQYVILFFSPVRLTEKRKTVFHYFC